MALILNIETSADACSVALLDGGALVSSRSINQPQAHASLLAPLIQQVLQESSLSASELKAVAISSGPGSYTGLRIGTSTAKGICISLNIPLIAIPTLELIAHEAAARLEPSGLLCPMIDARRMEVYCQIFNSNLHSLSPVSAVVIDNTSFAELLTVNPMFFFGSGSVKCKGIIDHANAHFIGEVMPNAVTLGSLAYKKYQLGEFEDIVNFTPFYLKEFVAKKSQSLL